MHIHQTCIFIKHSLRREPWYQSQHIYQLEDWSSTILLGSNMLWADIKPCNDNKPMFFAGPDEICGREPWRNQTQHAIITHFNFRA